MVKKTKQTAKPVAEPVSEKVEMKDDVKDEKGASQAPIDRASVEQCVSDIKAQGVVAIKALKKYFEDRGGKSLFPEMDYALSVTVVYKKPAMVTDSNRANIPLPYPDKSFQDSTVCLILPDLDQTQKGRTDPDVDKQAREWAEKIEKEHDLKNKRIKILAKRQLEREYHTYKERRALATQYDLFMVDNRVAKSVCTFVGKEFAAANKRPLWFDYFKPLATSIADGLKTTSFPLNRYMTRASVHAGHLGQDTFDISENVNAVIDRIVEVCPGGLPNVRSIYLQPSSSQPSLPIFLDQGAANDVVLKKENKHSRPDQKVFTDECNTLPDGLKLEVRKNGKLRVIRESDGRGVLYPTIHDEWEQRDITKPNIDPAQVEKRRELKAKRNAKRKSDAIIRAAATKKTRKV